MNQIKLNQLFSHSLKCSLQSNAHFFSAFIYSHYTGNPLYTDTRYNDKIRYNDYLTVTKPSLKRYQLVKNYTRILYLIL